MRWTSLRGKDEGFHPLSESVWSIIIYSFLWVGMCRDPLWRDYPGLNCCLPTFSSNTDRVWRPWLPSIEPVSLPVLISSAEGVSQQRGLSHQCVDSTAAVFWLIGQGETDLDEAALNMNPVSPHAEIRANLLALHPYLLTMLLADLKVCHEILIPIKNIAAGRPSMSHFIRTLTDAFSPSFLFSLHLVMFV